MRRRVAMCEIKRWLHGIKEKGFTRFTFINLREYGLDNRTFVRKARVYGLIRKVGMMRLKHGGNSLNVWEIKNNL